MTDENGFHPEESPNTPWPLRMQVLGTNRVLGIVIPNEERVTDSGLILPETKTHQDQPTACYIIKLSEAVTPEYRLFHGMREHFDWDNPNETLTLKPVCMYRPGAGDEWDFPVGEGSRRWVIVDMKSLRGAYIPRPSRQDNGRAHSDAVTKFNKDQLERVAENVPHKDTPSLIRVR